MARLLLPADYLSSCGKTLRSFALAARMIAEAIKVRGFFHRFAFRAAILSLTHRARTNRMCALLAVCHVFFSSVRAQRRTMPILASTGNPCHAIKIEQVALRTHRWAF